MPPMPPTARTDHSDHAGGRLRKLISRRQRGKGGETSFIVLSFERSGKGAQPSSRRVLSGSIRPSDRARRNTYIFDDWKAARPSAGRPRLPNATDRVQRARVAETPTA